MTGAYTLSPRAQTDLDEIWAYTLRHWGIDQTELYIRQICRDIATVAARPMIGRACPEIRAGYYKYQTGSHIFFYSLSNSSINVVRILHQRMDFVRQF